MRDRVQSVFFREPEGRKTGLLYIVFGVFWFVLSSVSFATGDLFAVLMQFLIGVGSVLRGLAELLPPSRKRLAGALRIAVLFVVVLIAITLLLMVT